MPNPLRADPSRTAPIAKRMSALLRKRFAELRRRLLRLVQDEDAFGLERQALLRDRPESSAPTGNVDAVSGLIGNAFCPTGKGGGRDNTCPPGTSDVVAVLKGAKDFRTAADAKAAMSKALEGIAPAGAAKIADSLGLKTDEAGAKEALLKDAAGKQAARVPGNPGSGQVAYYGKGRSRYEGVDVSVGGADKEGRAATVAAVKELLGADFDHVKAVHLVGAPPGSKVLITKSFGNSVNVSITGPDGSYTASRTIRRDENGKLVMNNNSFFVDKKFQGQGTGTKVFTDQVDACRKAGFDRIETFAARGGTGKGKMNGYSTWPKLGYDGPIPSGIKTRPPELAGAKTIQELHALPGGKEFWKAYGRSTPMSFDLTPGSKSGRVLDAYLEEKRKGTGAVANVQAGSGDEPNGDDEGGEWPDLSPEDEAALERAWERLLKGDDAQPTQNVRWSMLPLDRQAAAFKEWLKNQASSVLHGGDVEELWRRFVEEGVRKGLSRSFDDAVKVRKVSRSVAKNEVATTLADGTEVVFAPHPAAAAAQRVTVVLDPAKVDRAWREGTPSAYIPPGGGGDEIVGRRANVRAFIDKGKPLQASRGGLSKDGGFYFDDGRHRFSVLRDEGANRVAITVPLEDAEEVVRRFGVDAAPALPTTVPKADFLRLSLSSPPSQQKIDVLTRRSFNDLEGVSDFAATRASGTLLEGLEAGLGPREIARALVADLDVALGRATTIARTEIVRAHAEGQLQSLEDLGVEEVGVAVEWDTTGDGRVCSMCQPLEGVVLKLEEARGMLPRHPNCRCAWLPANVGEDKAGQKRSAKTIRKAVKTSEKKGSDGDEWEAPEVSGKRPKGVLNVALPGLEGTGLEGATLAVPDEGCLHDPDGDALITFSRLLRGRL